ncbi:MAG: hypothetical protein K9N47_26255 [Prosthecobacter sp.]|uniref:P-loop ATPase, Sll1717 family n=1 Tax=Prosthecobacter sp. TaxID=1965333 RepID=UPI002630E1B5|nr:hypothetical protein [Prosthecobacter sp.]MCF7789654.1 hypothetical protein [Prosthecobacter sp.]
MSLKAQQEIANWKLEARLEDNARYFYRISALPRLHSGEHSYVIGRKGSGKTALSEYLYQSRGPTKFTAKLTFKNFPFNDLYALTNNSYRQPNQYITLWKYLIYSSVAKLMILNEAIDSQIREQLRQVYADDPKLSLPRTIARWTSNDFDLKVMGSGIKRTVQSTHLPNSTPWVERVELLESIIENHLDESEYVLVFDELDEDYGAGEDGPRTEYWQLLTSLFKAVQDVRANIQKSQFRIRPIVFLRDDIYAQIRDADKNKWEDVIFRLEWTPAVIQDLLAFRISRAANLNGPILTFEQAWGLIYQETSVKFGTSKGKSLSSFDYITRAGCWRPRDYIRYMKATAQRAVDGAISPVSSEIVFLSLKEFSNYLRGEMEDEIGGTFPDIKAILDLIAHIRKPIFTLGEFDIAYQQSVRNGHNIKRNSEDVLRTLFRFSVIGNWTRQQKMVFHYTNREARLNLSEGFVVHPGLLRAFQIS